MPKARPRAGEAGGAYRPAVRLFRGVPEDQAIIELLENLPYGRSAEWVRSALRLKYLLSVRAGLHRPELVTGHDEGIEMMLKRELGLAMAGPASGGWPANGSLVPPAAPPAAVSVPAMAPSTTAQRQVAKAEPVKEVFDDLRSLHLSHG